MTIFPLNYTISPPVDSNATAATTAFVVVVDAVVRVANRPLSCRYAAILVSCLARVIKLMAVWMEVPIFCTFLALKVSPIVNGGDGGGFDESLVSIFSVSIFRQAPPRPRTASPY